MTPNSDSSARKLAEAGEHDLCTLEVYPRPGAQRVVLMFLCYLTTFLTLLYKPRPKGTVSETPRPLRWIAEGLGDEIKVVQTSSWQ